MQTTAPRASRGFTLIELMVVISIIGLLSSIVLAGVTAARNKAKDNAIISELVQFRNLYELTYSSSNSFASLQPQSYTQGCAVYSGGVGYQCGAFTQVGASNSCASIYGANSVIGGVSGNIPALNVCNNIIKNGQTFYIGLATTNTQQYSLWAFLPYLNKYMCIGSGGNNSTIATSPLSAPGNTSPGCPANP